MSYQFNPLSDEELDKFDLMENGIYDFEVVKATRKTSKSGNPMAELQLKIWDKEGKLHFVYDYLVFSTVNLNIRKVKHFCDAVGLVEQYKKGELPEDLNSYSGKAKIITQDKTPKGDGTFYAAKNAVEDYVLSDTSSGMKPLPAVTNDFDDKDIPF